MNIAVFPTAAAAAAAEDATAAVAAAGSDSDAGAPDMVRIVPCADTKPRDVAFDWDTCVQVEWRQCSVGVGVGRLACVVLTRRCAMRSPPPNTPRAGINTR